MINQTNILFFFQAEIHYDPFEQECEEFRERIGEIKEAKNAVKSFINICQDSSLPVLFSCKRVSCVTLVDGCCQAEGLQACFYFEGRVIKNGVAFKHSPLFFA